MRDFAPPHAICHILEIALFYQLDMVVHDIEATRQALEFLAAVDFHPDAFQVIDHYLVGVLFNHVCDVGRNAVYRDDARGGQFAGGCCNNRYALRLGS